MPAQNGSAVRDVFVNWGDGQQKDLGALSGTVPVSHTYTNAGTYDITATLIDAFGNRTEYGTSVSVVATPLPVVLVTPPSVPAVVTLPFSAAFTLQVTPPAGIGIQRAVVNFGDGTAPEQLGGLVGSVTKTHPYNSHNTFNVTLTVTDTLNRDTTGSSTITIP
jgi:PKD repeat protein